jgi:hypothetical protein
MPRRPEPGAVRIGSTPVIENSVPNFRKRPEEEIQTEALPKANVTTRAKPKLARHERYDPEQNETGREHEIGARRTNIQVFTGIDRRQFAERRHAPIAARRSSHRRGDRRPAVLFSGHHNAQRDENAEDAAE